jgi:hypothetical protein
MDPKERETPFYTAPEIRAQRFREKQAWLKSLSKKH